ncbi:MAG TPA: MBL fold metallo-hydrolase [Kofleriaceae bacterium]|nr:MBL fold metallo-hydrolase [Kofleriaceae bacterium]
MQTTNGALVTILASSLTACGGAAHVSALPSAHAPLAVHTFTSDSAGFDTHSFWIDTGREVVVFDGQFTGALADQVIADIRAQTRSPIRYLVVTHPNPDKFNGASRFQAAGAKVVASKATADAIPGVHAYKKYFFVELAKMFTEATYPQQATVDVTFDDTLDLPLDGDAHVSLRRLAHAGVSTTQTVAYVPEAKALFVGDLVHHDAHAWLEGGIANGAPHPDLASWAQALDELHAYPADTTIYGGRGEPALVSDALESEKKYLLLAGQTVAAYVASLAPAERAELDDPAKAQAHYVAIEGKLAAELPAYKLAYLVRYGVYGLVNATKSTALGTAK